jgi:4-aminobutyrate aminotransferase
MVVAGEGAWVQTQDGRRLLDFTSGMATLNLGHGHPRVLRAARDQLRRMTHTGSAYGHRGQVALAQRLAGVTPEGIESFLFAGSGSEAVELALRLARRATGRPGVVSFRGGFHGRTAGALSVTTSRAALREGVAGAPVAVAPFPRPWAWGVDADAAADRALAELDELHRHELSPGECACYIVEPIQGHGGCHPAGARFMAGLRARADRHGILLVLDEVQTGFGRTGAWFAADLYGVVPDVMCMAKALGAGLPLSAVGASRALMDALGTGDHGTTFGGSPLACATALAGIEAVEEEGLIERAGQLGRAAACWAGAAAGTTHIADVRGAGLMLGLELAEAETGLPRPDLAACAVEQAERRGVLLMRSGPEGSVVRLLPPLVVTAAELQLGLSVLEASLTSGCARSGTTSLLAA